MKDALKKNGYDNEEIYFAKRDRELIDQLQDKEKRRKEAESRGLRVIQGGGQGSQTGSKGDRTTHPKAVPKKAA